MHILIVEPYYGGSHRSFVDVLQRNSKHTITSQTMPPRYWKWRLSGAPFILAGEFKNMEAKPDALVFSNTIDISAFLALAGPEALALPKVIYFHENQLVYPLSEYDAVDVHYGLINITSALVADKVWFNSDYHRRTFIEAAGPFMSQFPDFVPTELVNQIDEKSSVLPVPVEPLPDVTPALPKKAAPLRILWNHRWEYDKAPEDFFEALEHLSLEGIPFQVAILGEGFRTRPPIFDRARDQLGDRVIRYGYADSREEYAAWVRSCDVVVSTARQEYFGVSIAEAVLAGCLPIVPKRLVYPDLIPAQHHANHIYDSPAGLLALLRKAALNVGALRESPPVPYYDNCVASDVVAQFDEGMNELGALSGK